VRGKGSPHRHACPSAVDWSVARSDREPGTDVIEKTKSATKTPKLHTVLLLNDDYTTMDFVVKILESVFDKPSDEAFRIMLEVHQAGRGLCGAYPWEVAETKVALVHELARREGFPLRALIEEA
jgi:ATP-dependent Clp protease adaptor protein ClpS